MSDTSISRKEYRNNRFTSDLGDLWQRESRSSFLARIAIESLPDRIIHMLEQKGLSLIDYGCAAGAGTAYIISHFPSLHVTGVDFSEEAVHKAISQHPQYNFEVGDLTGKLKEADIVFSSNMFEYLNDPLACLEQMVESAKQAAIVILPFEDSLTTKGHHHPFDVDSFPMEIGKHCLTYFRVIDCQDMPNTRWAGKQVLLVYALSTVHSPLSVGELYREWIGKLFDASHKFKRDLEYQQKQHEDALELQKSQFKQEQQERDKELSDIVAAYSGLKSKQTRAAMDQINSISQTRLYRLMHFMVEAWHAFFGKKEERIPWEGIPVQKPQDHH